MILLLHSIDIDIVFILPFVQLLLSTLPFFGHVTLLYIYVFLHTLQWARKVYAAAAEK